MPAIKARSLARPLAIFAATRIGVLLIAGGIAYDEHLSVLSLLTKWDGHWYLLAAAHGYPSTIPPGHGNAAQSALGFFPMYPIAIRLTSIVTGLGPQGASLVAGAIGGMVGAVLVWLLLRATYGERAADRGTALVFAAPGAFVLSMAYSETILVPMVAGCLLALHHRRWLVAGLLGAGATACDPVGMAVVVPCLIAAVMAIRSRREWRALLAPVIAPAGTAAFFGYLWVHDGTPFAWFIAQRRGWQPGRFGSGIWNQLLVIRGDHLALPPYTVKVAGLLVALGLLGVFLTTKRPATYTGYVVAVLVLAFLSPIVGFTPRLMLRAFPLLGVVGARAATGWFEALLVASTLAMAAAAVLSFGSLGLPP